MNRRRGSQPCTHSRRLSRGFTLLELGVAVLVFSLIAGVVTLAVARSQLTGAHARLQTAVESELRRMLGVAGTGSFDELVDGTFTRPEACETSAHQSCVEVLGRDFVVSWDVAAVADRTGESSVHAAGLRLSVSTALPDGTAVEIEHFVRPPGGGRDGTALLRVRLSGESYDGPVYLLDDADMVVGSSLASSGLALVRADEADCSPSPCRLALLPDGSTSTGDVAFSYRTLTGGASDVVLSESAVAETSVVLEPVVELSVLLVAENPDGRIGWNAAPGSVCLYLQFVHDGEVVDVPGCNSVSSDRVVFSTFAPVGAAAGEVAALPQGVELTVSSDPATGFCDAPGQKGWSAGSWVVAAVCTSWTWGSFDEIRDGVSGLGVAMSPTVTLSSSSPRYLSAVWAPSTPTSLSRPAGGSAGDPLWERPRDVPVCATTGAGECLPETGSPESGCPGGHCNSTGSRAPVLTAPRLGSYAVPAKVTPPGQSTSVLLTFVDNDGSGLIDVSVVNPPEGLSLSGVSLGNGDDIVTDAASPANVTLSFAAPVAFTGAQLELLVSDGSVSRVVTVALSDGVPEAFELHAGPVTVSQGGAATQRLLAIDSAGESMAAVSLVDSLPSGVSLGASAVVDGDVVLAFSASDPVPGVVSVALTSGLASTSFPLTVLPVAETVTVGNETIDQGASGSFTATVLDAGGDPTSGRHVWFTLLDPVGNVWPLGSVLATRGCLTDATGTCSVGVDVESSAVTGAFTVTASSDGVDDSATLTVGAALSRVQVTGASIEQGDAGSLSVQAFDGRNEPAAGVTISVSTAVTGLGVPVLVVTGVDGRASVAVSTSLSTPAGSASVTLTSGSYVRVVSVDVTATVASITAPAGPLMIGQNGNRSVTITALDPQGNPAPYKQIDVSASAGVFVPGNVLTAADGTAQVHLAADRDASVGAKTVSFLYDGVSLRSTSLNLVYGVGRIAASGTIESQAVSRVTLEFRSGNNLPLAGREVLVTSQDRRLTVSMVDLTTDATGKVRIDVTAEEIPAGQYLLVVSVDGRTINVMVETS